MKNRLPSVVQYTGFFSTGSSQKGSMILIVMMLLVIMSIIGISSTNTTVTENYIVRNTSIRKDNLYLVDAVASEAYQIVMDSGYTDDLFPNAFFTLEDIQPGLSGFNWVRNVTAWRTGGNMAAWYDRNSIGTILDTTNSEAPQDLIDNNPNGVAVRVLTDRGEWAGNPDNSPIRYALVGWEIPSGDSGGGSSGIEEIGENNPGAEEIRTATILVEYLSERYGVIRLVVGVKRNFS